MECTVNTLHISSCALFSIILFTDELKDDCIADDIVSTYFIIVLNDMDYLIHGESVHHLEAACHGSTASASLVAFHRSAVCPACDSLFVCNNSDWLITFAEWNPALRFVCWTTIYAYSQLQLPLIIYYNRCLYLWESMHRTVLYTDTAQETKTHKLLRNNFMRHYEVYRWN